jgi:hypothetical protein
MLGGRPVACGLPPNCCRPAAWAACRAPVLAARRLRLRRSASCHLKKNKRTEEVKIEEAKKGMELQNF